MKKQTELKHKLKKFLKKYTLDFIKEMTKDDYIKGKGEETFCWYVDDYLEEYGTTGGRTTPPPKHGIQWDMSKNKYSFGGVKVKKTKFGSEPNGIFENIRKSLISLIEDTNNNNYEGITKNKLSPPI